MAVLTYLTGGCHFSNLRHVCGDSFHALRSPRVSGVEMKIYERSLQALLSQPPCSRVPARLTSLTQIGELARRLAREWPQVGKCPAPGQGKMWKCPTPGTDKVGKCPAVARGKGGGGAEHRWN